MISLLEDTDTVSCVVQTFRVEMNLEVRAASPHSVPCDVINPVVVRVVLQNLNTRGSKCYSSKYQGVKNFTLVACCQKVASSLILNYGKQLKICLKLEIPSYQPLTV